MSRTLSWAGLALALFIVGFFLLFGKGASISGSWKYVMRTSDDSFYWASAQASTETPSSAGNPYFYEERGKSHTIPYPTVSLFGRAAQWLGVPVLTFFPLWHIGMPFLLWLALFLCLFKIWKYPEGPSAAIALVLLLSTLYLRDISHYVLLRFSRPGDSLWLLWIWLSGALHWPRSAKAMIGLSVLAAVSFWMNPFLAVLGLIVTAGEAARALFSKKFADFSQQAAVLLSLTGSALLYALYIKMNSAGGASSLHLLEADLTLGGAKIETSSLVLFGLALTLVAICRRLSKSPLTALDRVLLAVTGAVAFCGNIEFLMPGKLQLVYHRYNYFAELAYHRYAFTIVEIAAWAGWFLQKIPRIREQAFFLKAERFAAGFLALLILIILLNPEISFLRFAPNVGQARFLVNHPLLMLELIPVIFLFVWAYCAFPAARRFAGNPTLAAAILSGIAILGYSGMASQSYSAKTHIYRFENQPFGGAYAWLAQNARPGDVVMTIPPSRLDIDYLSHYTRLKAFIHPFGEKLTGPESKPDNTFRFLFYYHLLMGNLNTMEYAGLETTEKKLERLKLDYILVEMPSPFFNNIRAGLESYTKPAYIDQRCLLLSVTRKEPGA